MVDGDERARDGAARALTEAGHAVDTAATRADVVSLLGERAYDLVLSDLKMPALNGPVFYQLLKDSCRGVTPPVIFSIARGYTPEYASFPMRLAAPVLTKPVPAADLRQAVERMLSSRAEASDSLTS